MRSYKIEKNIPITKDQKKPYKYPWPEMELGDSVFIQAEEGQRLFNLSCKVGPAAHSYGKKTGKRFKTMLDRENNGMRVWRLE